MVEIREVAGRPPLKQYEVDVSKSALPSGAATSTIQTDGSQKTQIVDENNNIFDSQQLLDNTDDIDNKYGLVTASALYARTNGKVVPLVTDPTSHTLNVIDYAHAEIHNGDHFYIKNFVDLTNGQVLDFLAVTPNTTEWTHMLVEFEFEGEANVVIYEGTTTSNNGTPVATYNRDRNSSHTASLLVYTAPTVTGAGTQIAGYKAGSSQKVGGEVRATQELILKQNTKYLIRITNDTALNNWCNYLADWYEHVNLG